MQTCAIVAAADFNASKFCEMARLGAFDCVIAVDGGYGHLQDAGLSANVAIGDFDSLGYVPAREGLEVREYCAEKDESDLELAFVWANDCGFEHAYVFGALGGRLDHTLANLQIFAKFSEEKMFIRVIDLKTELAFITGPGALDVPACAEGTVSVSSMSDKCIGVSESGMKWQLDKVELTNRSPRGLSNEFMGQPVRISVEAGTLVVFLPL